MKKYDQHTVVVDNELWNEAAARASARRLSLSAVIRLLLAMWLRGDVRLEE